MILRGFGVAVGNLGVCGSLGRLGCKLGSDSGQIFLIRGVLSPSLGFVFGSAIVEIRRPSSRYSWAVFLLGVAVAVGFLDFDFLVFRGQGLGFFDFGEYFEIL